MTDAHEDLDPVRVCERLITTAKLLYAQCEGCVVNHYAHDFATQGAPGWLADCAADIEAAQALGAHAMKAACEAAGAGWSIKATEASVHIFAPDGSSVFIRNMDIPSSSYGDTMIGRLLYRLDTPPAVAAGRVKVSPAEAFEIGFVWRGMLQGQTLEDSRAVGRTLVGPLFDALQLDLSGFNSFDTADGGICDAKARILSALEGGGAQEDGEYRWVRFRQVESAPLVIEEDDAVPSGAGLDLEEDPAPALNLHDAYRRELAAKPSIAEQWAEEHRELLSPIDTPTPALADEVKG